MSEITDIKIAKGRKARKHIYIDDNYACSLDEFTIFKHKLHVGQSIELKDLEEICLESEIGTAFEKTVDLISVTPKTRKQVYDNLHTKGYLPAVCNKVLDKLQEYHYIDDSQYAKYFVDTYKNKYGMKKIEYLLLQKGVKKSIIEQVLSEMDSQEEIVKQLASKYMQAREKTTQNYQKLYRHLASKGFQHETIMSAVNYLKEEYT